MKNIALALAFILFMSTCERRTEVRLEGGNPPRFALKGNGRLGTILVFGPQQERIAQSNPSDTTYALWEVQPEEEGEDGAVPVEDLKVISYGVVPSGYKQVKPTSGAPPQLDEGKRYRYWFVTVNAPHAAGYFEIRDGKVISVSGP